MSKALESGKTFLAGVLAKLPEGLRGQVETAFNDPSAADALVVVGSGALAQSDINRKYQEIETQKTELDTAIAQAQSDYQKNQEWWTKTSAEYERLKALDKGGTPPVAPVVPPVAGLSKEDVEKVINENNRSYASVLGLSMTLSGKHFKDFGEVLDGNALIAFAEKNRLSLDTAYNQMFAEKIAAKAATEDQARIDKIVQERLAAERKTAVQPFPLRNQEPSVLDVLEAKDKPTLPDPAEFYNQLSAARG
jgi:hypothetical protein